MSHAYVLVCDGDQQQKAGPSFSKYGRQSCVDLLATYRLIDLQSRIS